MAIVLPKKKKIDVFAPSQAIQDAKNKLGPAYFDVTLLKCSRNAVELTKLVGKWGDLDKEKVKVIRDIEKEQLLLLRSLKLHRLTEKSKTCLLESVETPDGKLLAPGFRFKANGELKTSTHALAHIFGSKESTKSDSCLPQNNTSLKDEENTLLGKEVKQSSYITIDYDKEINELQEVIDEIYANLAKNKKTILTEQNQGRKNFLRAHSHDYIVRPNIEEKICEQPNDRFAFQPGTQKKRYSYLHNQKLKTPSQRTCIGCQCKLKYERDDLTKLRKLRESELGKIKWCYVPQGRIVQSSTSIFNRRTSVTKSAMRQNSSKKDLHRRSAVHFDIKNDTKARSACSANYAFSVSCGNESDMQSMSAPALSASRGRIGTTQRSSDVSSERSRILSSSLSYGSGLSRARVSSAIRIDHESRLNMLKEMQAQQKEQCEHKVRDFLHKLDSATGR